MRAYELLSAIEAMLLDRVETYAALQRPLVLKILLMIGVYADARSMVSVHAFRLAEIVLYGDKAGNLGAANCDEFQPIVDEMADDFRFEEPFSVQMVAGFPIFWNHRYKSLDSGDGYEKITVELGNGEVFESERGEGKTPLEFCIGHVFDDPPLFQSLSNSIVQVLRDHEEATKLRRERVTLDSDPEELKELLKMDMVFVDFLRTKFDYHGAKVNFLQAVDDPANIWRHFPLLPTDEVFQESGTNPHRVPVNGAPFDLAVFLIKSQMFEVADGLGPFAAKYLPRIPEDIAEDILRFQDMLMDSETSDRLLLKFWELTEISDIDPMELTIAESTGSGD
jgi:hypothetical protein